MENVENLILEQLRYLRAGQDAMREDMAEVKTRIGRLEQETANLYVAIAELSSRVDRMSTRLDRVEKRLELTDTP